MGQLYIKKEKVSEDLIGVLVVSRGSSRGSFKLDFIPDYIKSIFVLAKILCVCFAFSSSNSCSLTLPRQY